LFIHPPPHHDNGVGVERSTTRLSTLSEATDVRTFLQSDVLTTKPRKFRYSQPGLDGRDEQGVITTTDPSGSVWCCQQCGYLCSVEERDISSTTALGGNRQDPLYEGRVLGMTQCGEPEE
jgi:hypothetical protein